MRIAAVDGLRAVAAVGVLWAHVWAFSGTPAWTLGRVANVSIDLNRAISALGTGVDLFFVISGFCMHLMYARNESRFEPGKYWAFIKRRWLRIAPAFYVAVAACALGHAMAHGVLPVRDVIAHFAFLHIVIPGTGLLAAPFWSLATEWHFYLLLPLLIALVARFGTLWALGMAIAVSIGARLWFYGGGVDDIGFWKAQLPVRLIEFLWGILVSELYQRRRLPPRLLCGGVGFVSGIVVAYAGRLLMVSEVVKAAGTWGWVLEAMAEPVLTLGFALVIWNVVMTESWGRALLEHPVFLAMGRWSYSLYLWHWWPAYFIAKSASASYGSSVLVQHVAFAATLAILIPVSWLSYRMLERPYFQRHHTR
jgi:peptidoglycan/LPS O-acetylase OafA/YrhL